MDRSIPVLASSSIPHLKATTAGSSGTLFNRNLNASREFQFAPRNVHLVEVARCPVEMVEKQVNATVAFWYNSLNQQRISGHRKPHPFPVYGSTKRVVLLPSFVTTIEKAAVNVGTAGSDAATAKTPFSKRRSSVASSTAATMPEETEKGRIQISGIAYDADKQVLILSVHSSLYPTLAMVVAVDKMSMPSSSAKLAALNGSVSSAPSFRFEARVLFGVGLCCF